ncbi:MAG: asparaginase domain-containing protein [Planctomycetota bacterium]
MPESIRIIVTGGTLDKEYDHIEGRLGFSQTHLPQMLAEVRCTVPVAIEPLLLEDSLDLTEADRESILDQCEAAPETRIIITHGTDTMVETAHLLGGRLTGKTVVLVGAMVPYAFGKTDALFNLGTAVAAVQLLPVGIYITMNGRVFPWDNVRKDRTAGNFVSLRPE